MSNEKEIDMMECNAQTKTDKQDFRKSNIELLRIVAMVMIVAHHYAYHGGFAFPKNELSINRFWIQLILSGGTIGVDVFVLISGFFLVSSEHIRINKIIRTWAQLLFYSFILFFCFVFAGIEPFGLKKLLISLAPVTYNTWWFASSYFVLYLLSPYINILLKSFNKKQYIFFLASLFFYWCIIPTITYRPFQSNFLLWFVFLYSLAGYVKIFGVNISLSGGKLIALSFVCILCSALLSAYFDLLGTKSHFFEHWAMHLYDMQCLPILIISFLLFIGFSKMNIGYNKLINIVASATFGVYLIHEHPFVRPFLWKRILKGASYSESYLLIPYSLLAVFLVFACCTIIELLRKEMIEKQYMNAVNNIANLIPRLLTKTINGRIRKSGPSDVK